MLSLVLVQSTSISSPRAVVQSNEDIVRTTLTKTSRTHLPPSSLPRRDLRATIRACSNTLHRPGRLVRLEFARNHVAFSDMYVDVILDLPQVFDCELPTQVLTLPEGFESHDATTHRAGGAHFALLLTKQDLEAYPDGYAQGCGLPVVRAAERYLVLSAER
jgi:hypothetical protein